MQHGRVKVRSSEEEKEIKRKQREEKLKKFLFLKNQIFTKVWCVAVFFSTLATELAIEPLFPVLYCRRYIFFNFAAFLT